MKGGTVDNISVIHTLQTLYRALQGGVFTHQLNQNQKVLKVLSLQYLDIKLGDKSNSVGSRLGMTLLLFQALAYNW